jgi:hypothetical protein
MQAQFLLAARDRSKPKNCAPAVTFSTRLSTRELERCPKFTTLNARRAVYKYIPFRLELNA